MSSEPESTSTGTRTGTGTRTRTDPSLPGRLARVLVCSTIEFDSLVESRMPHRTTTGPASNPAARAAARERLGSTPPWLVSRSSWENSLALIPDEGIRAQELARTPGNPAGLARWGYLRESGGLLHLTRAGRAALRLWPEVAREVDARWLERHGPRLGAAVDAALAALRDHGPTWPFAPQLGYPDGLHMPVPESTPEAEQSQGAEEVFPSGQPDLARGLSRLLQLYTRDYERQARVSLAIASTVLASIVDIAPPSGFAVRDLPVETGLSRAAVDAMLGWLRRHGLVVDVDGGRGPHVAATERGVRARAGYRRILRLTDQAWSDAVGAETLRELSSALDEVLANRAALLDALTPPPGTWRGSPPALRATEALLRDPAGRLPAYPVVLHRGGFPDGS